MLKKMVLVACALVWSAHPIAADHHKEGGPMPPAGGPPHLPALVIPLSDGFEPPPPEDGPEAFVGAALEFLDTDGDEALSGEEIRAAMDAAMPDGDGHGPPPHAQGDKGDKGPPPHAQGDKGDKGPPPHAQGDKGHGPPPHAQGGEGDGPRHPLLVIPVPGAFEPPAPEEGPEAFMKAAFAALDTDGDGILSKEEIKAALEHMMGHGGPQGDHGGPGNHGKPQGDHGGPGNHGGPQGDHGGPQGDHGDHGGDQPMDPQWEMADCNGAEGNHVIRQLVASPGSNAVAISLPEGRVAGCFEVTGGEFSAQIIEETNPPSDPAPVVWSSDSGADIGDLVISGAGIFHFELTSDDGAEITLSYVDYPASE